MFSQQVLEKIILAQENEITEADIYRNIAKNTKDKKNRDVLIKIAEEEELHYKYWKNITKQEIKPNQWKIWKYSLIAKILGLTFAVKLMEEGEKTAQIDYEEIIKEIPEAKKIQEDEDRHELELIELIEEERLEYMSSVVLGLNDALVELTGALAGLTLALQNPKLIAVVGLITGISASLSMASSEYLSTKEEDGKKNPIKAAIYTGIVYIVTVILLITPYLIFNNLYFSLFCMLVIAIAIIFVFTYYLAVAKSVSFKKNFLEMAGLSLGVATFSFILGYLIREVFGIEI